MAEVTEGLFLKQDSVAQAAVAGLGTVPEAVYAEARGRGAHGEVGHHVGHAPQHPHCTCPWSSRTSTQWLAGDGLN